MTMISMMIRNYSVILTVELEGRKIINLCKDYKPLNCFRSTLRFENLKFLLLVIEDFDMMYPKI